MTALCAMAGLNRAGYYRFRLPCQGIPMAMELRDEMQKIALQSPSYGYRRIMNNALYLIRGAAPETLGFIALAPEPLSFGAASAAPAVPASESTLGSHPCVALSSAQVLTEWTTATTPCNDLSTNGNYPLNLLSQSRGPLHRSNPPCASPRTAKPFLLKAKTPPPRTPEGTACLQEGRRTGLGPKLTQHR